MIDVVYEDEYILLSMEEGGAKLSARVLCEDSIEYELEGLSEEEQSKFYSITKYHEIVLVESLSVDKNLRGRGFASLLLQELFKITKQKDYKYLYLNACPILGDQGLDLEALESFYARKGFKAFINQGSNVLMVKSI